MGITLEKSQIERAHKIGRFQANKSRPVVVNFCHFKDKESILASGSKLKSTDYAVREHFSLRIRQARKKLFEFAKPRSSFFKIRYDKLLLDDCCYVYDAVSDRVVQSKR